VRLDYREMMADLAVPLSEDLSRLGVSVQLNPLPDRAFFELLESGGSALYLLRFSCRYGDSQELLDHWVHSRNEAAGLGTANYSYTACPVAGLDAEIDSARRRLTRARDRSACRGSIGSSRKSSSRFPCTSTRTRLRVARGEVDAALGHVPGPLRVHLVR
jgi:hypothetical protein